jgi:hypothetical protein
LDVRDASDRALATAIKTDALRTASIETVTLPQDGNSLSLPCERKARLLPVLFRLSLIRGTG